MIFYELFDFKQSYSNQANCFYLINSCFQVYTATIIDNIPFNPASPIIQLLAEDADIGINGALYFFIIGGNEKGQFKIDNSKGIIYPNTSFVGQKGATFELAVQVYDEGGAVQAWPEPDR